MFSKEILKIADKLEKTSNRETEKIGNKQRELFQIMDAIAKEKKFTFQNEERLDMKVWNSCKEAQSKIYEALSKFYKELD